MAIEYGCDLGGAATADEVDGVLAGPGGAGFVRPGARLPSGVLVVVRASRPSPFPGPVQREFGFAPAVHVLFRFDKFADLAEQRQDMIRLIAALLSAFPGDAALTFAGETVRLVRRAGHLTISDRDDLWPPRLTALLPTHARAPLPTL